MSDEATRALDTARGLRGMHRAGAFFSSIFPFAFLFSDVILSPPSSSPPSAPRSNTCLHVYLQNARHTITTPRRLSHQRRPTLTAHPSQPVGGLFLEQGANTEHPSDPMASTLASPRPRTKLPEEEKDAVEDEEIAKSAVQIPAEVPLWGEREGEILRRRGKFGSVNGGDVGGGGSGFRYGVWGAV